MAGIDNSAILLKANFQFKGPLTENFILQQLKGQYDVQPRYYSTRYGEIDFLLQDGQKVIPVEMIRVLLHLKNIFPKSNRKQQSAFRRGDI